MSTVTIISTIMMVTNIVAIVIIISNGNRNEDSTYFRMGGSYKARSTSKLGLNRTPFTCRYSFSRHLGPTKKIRNPREEEAP